MPSLAEEVPEALVGLKESDSMHFLVPRFRGIFKQSTSNRTQGDQPYKFPLLATQIFLAT